MTKYLIGPATNPRQAVWVDDKDPKYKYLRSHGFDKIFDVEVEADPAPVLPVEFLDALVEARESEDASDTPTQEQASESEDASDTPTQEQASESEEPPADAPEVSPIG